MAPEMALSYIIGTIPSVSVTGIQFLLHNRKIKSKAYQQLQLNLGLIQKYWCESQGQILDLTEDAHLKDDETFRKSLFLMGIIFFFLSWVGFIFNMIVLFSIHFIAVSRKEKKIFASELCQKDLTSIEIERILKFL